MNILVVGGDTKGAWQMRGVQLGGALGARVTATPRESDWTWADVVVLVKRAAIVWQAAARRVRVPVVWDVLDFWAQPDDNIQPSAVLLQQVRQIQEAAGVSALIGATLAMADDLGGVYLPHHCRLGLQPEAPRREQASVVGYDGKRKYLGRWLPALEQACGALGLQFVVNPPDLRAVDALVSFRDGRWDGDVCRRWKSGVKYVNAIAAGRPMLTQECAASVEMGPVGCVIENIDALAYGLESVTSRGMRDAAVEHGRTWATGFTVEAIAGRYVEILQQARRLAA